MKFKLSLVITTINHSNKINKIISLSKKHNTNLIIIGDKKTPKKFKISFGKFFDINMQKKLKSSFAKRCPYNSYSRKNIGYLSAIKDKSDFIVETDDDNLPDDNFFSDIKLRHRAKGIKNKGWVNIYKSFLIKKINIWPRGLPLECINTIAKLQKSEASQDFYLQQGICNGDPDVDAIFRILNVKKNIIFKKKLKFSIKPKTFIPINSQNTLWHRKIFPLLYLPSFCPMRVTDIIRGLIAKIILSNDNKSILFKSSNVFQNRNFHDLSKDLREEMIIYKSINNISKMLKNLKMSKGEKNYPKNLVLIYKKLISAGFFKKKELSLLKFWIADVQSFSKSS